MVRMEICVHTILSPGVGHKVGLELGQVHVEGAVKPQRGRDGGHDLPNQPVEVGVGTITEVYYIILSHFSLQIHVAKQAIKELGFIDHQ